MALHSDTGITVKQSIKDIFLYLSTCFLILLQVNSHLPRVSGCSSACYPPSGFFFLSAKPDCVNFHLCFFHFIMKNQRFFFLFTSLNKGE